jgi:hypothetical protein
MPQPDSWFFIAVAESQPVGFTQFVIRQEVAAQLTRICLLPEWGCKSGRILRLRAGLRARAVRGCRHLLGEVEKENQVGKAIYHKHGFEFSGERPIELPEQQLVLEESIPPISEGDG